MEPRSPTEQSSPELEQDDLPAGVSEELSDALAELEAGADFDADEAAAAALDDFTAMVAEYYEQAGHRPAVVEIAGTAVTVQVGHEIVIGRRGAHQIDHPLVSRRHLAVMCHPNGILARDLDSANGSWLVRGGEQIALGAEPIELVALDRIVTAGDVELLRVPGAR